MESNQLEIGKNANRKILRKDWEERATERDAAEMKNANNRQGKIPPLSVVLSPCLSLSVPGQ